MNKIEVKKGQILQRKGDLNTKVYQVESGLLRSYSIDEKGKEHIYMFAPENWIVADSLPPEKPCELFIDALEDSVVILNDKNDLSINDTESKKIIKRFGVLQKRIIMLMSASAIERYEHFIETYPDIVQRVPQKLIASYLGITPEALSAAKRTRALKK
ncbi:MAG: Crp/Fnr family transcriptional regulator [Balneola sp.]|uniref:Crp/Fnr family transcriptional regulator n=1 Tax=Balneola sp. EhC07 TaxID=1849360 RepID=UPI0007F36730|nr:Crp/Fnr family transcriptional regulator [Balneola sp. EhC07]OAN62132.1 Crp/Fnr family transcriptional regulator [Balneola sp. EhC07]